MFSLYPSVYFSFVHVCNILVNKTDEYTHIHGTYILPNNPEAFSLCNLRFWLITSDANNRDAHNHCVIVGALGIRLWDAGCLLRSSLERIGKEAGSGEGKVELWSRPNNSLSQHQWSYGTRMTFLSRPALGQDPLPLAIREKTLPHAGWLSIAEAIPEGSTSWRLPADSSPRSWVSRSILEGRSGQHTSHRYYSTPQTDKQIRIGKRSKRYKD